MKLNRRNVLKALSLTGLGSAVGLQAQSGVPTDPECLTTADIQGPFYIPGAPNMTSLAPKQAPGTPVFITGTVYASDCTTPVADAEVDVWHANDAGGYEDDHYRGKVRTGANGQYAFSTILPGKYLNGSQFRPRHFHYKVSAQEVSLTTQIYFAGDTSIPIDHWASHPDAEERIITLVADQDNALHGVADIYLDVAPIINDVDKLKEEQRGAHIRSIHPNPLHTDGHIELFLPAPATVDLHILDLHGRSIKHLLQQEQLASAKHTLAFDTIHPLDIRMTNGVYVLQLSVDHQVVDGKRFVIVG